jgi:pimeloyl-ACP methyl ester carboxylesterase
MRVLTLIPGFVFLLHWASAQEVIRITWPTSHASPPATIPNTSSQELAAIRLGLFFLSESNAAQLAINEASALGVSEEDARNLQQVFGERYRIIQNDRVFCNVASALPYCFSAQTPTQGLALVYCPKKLDPGVAPLVFLHGYGGSFLWTQQLLAEAFPTRLIICPAFGISSALMPSTYLSECLQAVEKNRGCPIKSPVLIGLSAGGFGACSIYVQSPKQFSRLIVLAAYPSHETLGRFSKQMSVRFLAGAKEDYVQSGLFGRYMQSLRSRVSDLQSQTIPGANHFFLLSKKDQTLSILRAWLEIEGSKN